MAFVKNLSLQILERSRLDFRCSIFDTMRSRRVYSIPLAKCYVIFESSPIDFALLQNSVNSQVSNLGPKQTVVWTAKMPLAWTLGD